uniref:Serine peptidase inhibitor Kazal type 4 n=1 Tax=Equus caballus TaxID=9796 RepID=A0A5F5PTF2_HORSE
MAVRLWVVVLTLAALLVVDRQVPASAGKPIFSRMPDHVAESLDCPQTSSLAYGTDQVTYDNDCQLCLTRIKTKDIQIRKDGKCQ